MKKYIKHLLPSKIIYLIKTKMYFYGMTSRFPRVYDIQINKNKVFLSNYVDVTHWDRLSIGQNVFIWHFTILDSFNGIAIGDDCQIGTRVGIFTHSSHNSIRYYNKDYHNISCYEHMGRIKGAVEIGESTFIGANAIIMPNTKIGKGCIVAGFSYVQGVFDDFSIIAGNPAKKIGDVRKMDLKFLKSNPELEKQYFEYFKIGSRDELNNFPRDD
jgi:acetyltransferase-like isoleucine patch superfamily enzyme